MATGKSADAFDLVLSQVGLRILRRRQKLGMTQKQLAAKAEISPALLSRIELGEQNFTMRTAWQLAEALDTTLEYLLLGALKGEDDEG